MALHFFKNEGPKRFWQDFYLPKTFEAIAEWRKARPAEAWRFEMRLF